MKYLTFFSLILLIVGSSINLHAQSEKNTAAKQSAVKYAEAIDLNSEQAKQMEVILTEFYTDAKSNMQTNKSESEAYKETQRSIFQETDAKIKALLNEEQMAAYQKKKFELRKEVLEHYLRDKKVEK